MNVVFELNPVLNTTDIEYNAAVKEQLILSTSLIDV